MTRPHVKTSFAHETPATAYGARPRGGVGSGSRSSPAPRAGSAPPPCGGSPPTTGTWSRWTAPRTTRGCRTRSATVKGVAGARLASGCSPSKPTRPTSRRFAPRPRRPSGAGAGSTRSSPRPGAIAGGVPAWELDRGARARGARRDARRRGWPPPASCVPALLRRPEPRDGRFIAVASAAATRGLPKLAAYSAAKAGVVGFVRALAVELGGTGVTANCVSPGSTRTKILDETARLYGMEPAEQFAAQQPLGRLLEPDEIAPPLAWLALAAEPRRDRRRLPARRRPRPCEAGVGSRSVRLFHGGRTLVAPRPDHPAQRARACERCAPCSRTRPRPAQQRLGERLIDAGFAHPRPAPKRDRRDGRDPGEGRPGRASPGASPRSAARHPTVLVVDDGSG